MDFWEQFWPQLIATVIGAGIGIPAGIWLNHLIERGTESKKKEKILAILKIELMANKGILEGWVLTEQGDLEASVYGAILHDESWRVFSEGGELEWIKDPQILYELSLAYYEIRSVQRYSEKYFDMVTAGKNNISMYTSIYNLLTSSIDDAIIIIDRALSIIKDNLPTET